MKAGKVVDNFKFYVAIVSNSKEAQTAKIGDSVKLKMSTGIELLSNIIYIGEELDGVRVLVFETTSYAKELISYRKISLDIVWWNEYGYKVPNSALIQENELYYITRNRARILR